MVILTQASLSIELGDIEDPAVNEIALDLKDNIFMVGALKIKNMYEKVAENIQVCVLVQNFN